MHVLRSTNFSIVPELHQGIRLPSLSNCRPLSSKPCVISWPITAPIPVLEWSAHWHGVDVFILLTTIVEIPQSKTWIIEVWRENVDATYLGASLLKKGVCRIPAGKAATKRESNHFDKDVHYWFDSLKVYRRHWPLLGHWLPMIDDRPAHVVCEDSLCFWFSIAWGCCLHGKM